MSTKSPSEAQQLEEQIISGDEVSSSKDGHYDEEYSYKEQRKIIHKVDRRLITVAGLLVAVSLMDRSNLGNAAIAGYVHHPCRLISYRIYVCRADRADRR